MVKEKVKIHPAAKDWFRQFARNGRWGTCGACPRDSDGNVFPEFCKDTDRHDHHLDIDGLVEQHKSRLRDLKD